MISYAPTWALSAQAIDAAGDPHLAKGVHLRLMPGAALGLPIFPFRVYRLNLGQPGLAGWFRSDGVRFVDSKNKTLTTPFTMSAGNPVTAYLPAPADGICCWIEIIAEPSGAPGLRAEAQVAGDRGLSTLATATAARYQMAAARIDRVVLTGNARISGVIWIDGRTLWRTPKTDLWRVLSLPLAASALYSPTAAAVAEATERIKRGGPQREPMYKAPGAAGPAQAPLIANPAAAEKLRVEAANADAKAWLSGLVAAGSTAPAQRKALSKTNTPTPVALSMGLLDAVWMSSLDPGLSRWLGFGDVDELPPGNPGDVLAYVVKGIWQQGLGSMSDDLVLAMLAAARIDTLAGLDAAKELMLANPAAAKPPFFELFSAACATLGKPGLGPTPPLIESFEYKPFLPALPPAARREIVLCAKGFAPGPGAALSRLVGGVPVSLNPKIKGQTVALLVSSPQDSAEAGRGRLSDRQAPATEATYRLAQADWFGRWSPWSQAKADAAKRPKPPQPVLQLGYTPPDPALWGQAGPLAGSFSIVVPVPANESLAPGAWPLATLKLMLGITPVTASVASANAQGNLVLTVPGPALLPCASTAVTVKATWVDSAGVPSDDSLPVVRQIRDPRAPAPVTLDYALAYASRPDATGKSRIDLRWPAAGAQHAFRVYYASETSLLSRLAATQPALAASIQQTASLPQRAQLFKDHKNAFDRDWFELLTHDPLLRGNASEMRLVHPVSGKLATLGFYRVASVSAANVEGGFDSTTMVAYAVPNAAPPTMPLLDAAVDPATGVASVLLRVPRSAVPAAFFRLRRTTGTASDATLMRVVKEGAVGPAAATDAMQQATLSDAGLKPWRRYFWRAEVRGADLPGSTLKGAWSRPSAPVEAVVIPDTPPLPASQVVLTATPSGVTISFVHDPAALNGGSVGRFRLDLYKHLPGDRERSIATLWADAPQAQGGFDAQGHASFIDKQPAPPGTVYRVLVTDPLGRSSAGNVPVTVPKGI